MHGVGRTIALLLLGAGLAGCGSSSSGGSSGSAPIPAPQHPARELPMLATSTLPDLDHTEHGLDLSALAAEGPKGGDLQAHLADWSYRTGSEREFKGGTPSRYLDVVSRTLVLRCLLAYLQAINPRLRRAPRSSWKPLWRDVAQACRRMTACRERRGRMVA